MGTAITIDGFVSQTLSQEVTFELSPKQEKETRPGLAFWFAM